MRYFKYLALLAVTVIAPVMYSHAQVAIGVQIGPNYGLYNPPPVCEFGYYPYYPYDCSPYGYWGPTYFVNGVFIGAGPWYRFYYLHPTYWGRFYFPGRFYGDRFRAFNHGFRGGPAFRGQPVFRGNEHAFRGGERGFRNDHEFRADRGFRGNERGSNGGGRNFARRGGENLHAGRGSFHRGGSHGGGHGRG
ncbi:MAG TPA: hypothetical protein VIX19_09330 [Terriglobales bacterium]